MKKKIAILFNGAHLAYSPTVVGLYDLLSEKFDVTILAEKSAGEFNYQLLTNRKIIYREPLTNRNKLRFYRRLFDLRSIFDSEIAALKKLNFETDAIYDFTLVRKTLAELSPDFIVAVDFKNLLYAQILQKSVEFLSLEIVPNDKFYAACNFQNINSVVVQTAERYEHLFGDRELKIFFVQNAPVYVEHSEKNVRKNLIYCGTAWNPFGFYHCLEFLREFPEYAMNVKGAIFDEDRARVRGEYADLLAEKRLVIDDEYLNDADLVEYLRQFKIGFCFYNFELKWVNNFNYLSAPSGKMFKYMAAGVPVVGQNILGLKPVKDFDCGVLIEDLKPASIKKACEKIEANFEFYSQNSLRAAEFYSFDKRSAPFIEYLLEK